MVEQRTFNPLVVGSIPIRPTKIVGLREEAVLIGFVAWYFEFQITGVIAIL